MLYFAILDNHGDVWGARFPDLPGVNGGGGTPEAAIRDAKSAAREWIAHVIAKGGKVPRPRSIEALKEAGEIGPGEAAFMAILPVQPEPGRTVKANITIEAGLLEAIDEAAKTLGLTRSAFIARAALDKMDADT